ncbi:GMC family oxidoreductase [Plectonema radiosum NIES-515]|uniref:GMC family oxidoreductase n=1 Tax=Plectonema radiosum NIES-515 TaxID=2986073 RepID=A0ABT3AXT6_9CYAN|nr:GMC family oxidoreductase [Plectonema radiosum]MCV3213937.1 GMC family oxidoreductase [Plectonema radiosum NIES-515]
MIILPINTFTEALEAFRVDANCQVHGISNLFIAGSSVFPTGGYANPTLTIIAFAIRLADRVKTQFAAKSENVTTDLLQTAAVTDK